MRTYQVRGHDCVKVDRPAAALNQRRHNVFVTNMTEDGGWTVTCDQGCNLGSSAAQWSLFYAVDRARLHIAAMNASDPPRPSDQADPDDASPDACWNREAVR